jgi:alpha-galactosidase
MAAPNYGFHLMEYWSDQLILPGMRKVVVRASLLAALLTAACSSSTSGDAPDAALPPPTPDAGDVDPPNPDAAPLPDATPPPDAGPPPPVHLALTPPMGWNSWNKFGCNIDENLIKGMADAMVATGMKDAGYEYVVIDDCWAATDRDANGVLVADATRFPGGIAALADYVHAKGLKLGLYTDAGDQGCQGKPGSRGHEVQDAQTFAAWGVDYVKSDWCNTNGLDPRTQYTLMHDALLGSGRDIVFSLTSNGAGKPWFWGSTAANLWRNGDDIADNWGSMIGIVDNNSKYAAAARPGGWNDPDSLEVGNGGMNDGEYRVHFSMWAMMASPLMAGNDLRSMTQSARDVLLNRGVIAIDQDALGVQATLLRDSGGLQVWVRPLAQPGARAVALVNRSGSQAEMTVSWSELGLQGGDATVRDLWRLIDNGPTTDAFTARVPSHDVVLLRIVGQEPAPPTGNTFVSDATWVHAANAWGVPERDRSNGEQGATDGHPMKLAGTSFAKGVGVHAGAILTLNLGGACTTFNAKVGVDDEVGDRGSVVFSVWSGAERLYQSGILTGSMPIENVSVDVTGKADLRLMVDPGLDNNDYDHSDWADAQVVCN